MTLKSVEFYTKADELNEAGRFESGAEMEIEQLIAQSIRWIDLDRKITPLKSLQGTIWQFGYRQGSFKGHIYEDAARQAGFITYRLVRVQANDSTAEHRQISDFDAIKL